MRVDIEDPSSVRPIYTYIFLCAGLQGDLLLYIENNPTMHNPSLNFDTSTNKAWVFKKAKANKWKFITFRYLFCLFRNRKDGRET